LPPAATPKISLASLPRGKVIWVYVNLREGPGIQYKIIGRAYMKNTFELLAENPDWLRVRLENGTVGWMSKKATESLTIPSSQSPPASFDDSTKAKSSSKRPSPM
jgi:N-acetylmuramoyl-L-alanine amidase